MKLHVRCAQVTNNATLFSSANRNLSSNRQADRRSRFAPEKDARSSPGYNVKGVSEWRDRGATWSGGKTRLSWIGIDHDWSIPRSRHHHRRLAPDRDPGSGNRREGSNQHPLDEERRRCRTGEREAIISAFREVDERLGPPAETDAFLRWRHSRGRGARGQHRTVRAAVNMADLERIRLVVLGGAGVGKSAIIRRLLGQGFNERYRPTVEDLYSRECVLGTLTLKVDLLDTAGKKR